MNIVDSSGWMEYFADGSNADYFAPIIENKNELLVPTICLYEVFKSLQRQAGKTEALEKTIVMRQGIVVDLTAPIAFRAASLSLRHQLPTADSIILATAQTYRARVWTQDSDFEGLPDVKFRRKK